MAFQWHPRLRNTFARCFFIPNYNGGVSWTDGNTFTCAITIYGGTQPTAANFLTNWDATYKSAHLINFRTCVFTQPNPTSETLGFSVQCTTLPSSTNAANTGTGTFAVIWKTNITDGSLAIGTIPDSKFMIVPFTATGGNGIVRMPSTSFTSGNPYTLGSAAIQVPTIN